MERKNCPAKAELLLLGITAAFLCLVLGLSAFIRSGAGAAQYEGFTVETERAASSAELLPPEEEPVDINAAGVEELATLPGIGEKLARRIVDYRAEHGPFSAVDELVNVSGIGEGKLEARRGHVRAG